MTFSKKRAVIPLTLIIICLIVRGGFLYSMSVYPFASFCKEMALDSLTNNPFELHYTIAYPEEMGLTDITNDLIPFHSAYYTQNQTIWQERARILKEIIPSRLNKEEAFLYELLSRHIDLQLKSLEFPYYENPLSCSGGTHSQLPILLAEYALRSKADIENYFKLLSQIPAYLASLGTYATEQEAAGIYMFQGNIREVQAQCLELFPADQLQYNNHFLQTAFHTRLQELVEQNIITSAEASDYEKRHNTLLINDLAPAYKALAASMTSLKGTPVLTGLSTYPLGKDYYALLLNANTGSDKTVEEIKAILYQRYDTLYQAYINLLQKNTYVQNWTFPITGHSQMLSHLYEQSQIYFPALSQVTGDTAQQVQLKTVDGTLADMSAPAFYMTPPIDANDEHAIYINPDAKMEALDLYTTLAHEGFPGHLYQTVYSQTALEQAGTPLIRQLLYYGGFTEGWAVYAELYSYDFVINSCDTALTDTLKLNRLNREIQLCLCSILDIFIHYEGASLQEVEALLSNLGLNTTSAVPIYEAVCDAPANYPKYYVGYLEILELKENAKELWGEEYSDYDFHKWMLETGPGDFGSLEQKLKRDTK